jgi:hypothetical protein
MGEHKHFVSGRLLRLAAELARGEHMGAVGSLDTFRWSKRSRLAFENACDKQADEHKSLAVHVRNLSELVREMEKKASEVSDG